MAQCRVLHTVPSVLLGEDADFLDLLELEAMDGGESYG